MKRCLSIFVISGLLVPTALLPYTATKKGIVVEAIDYARTPNALCIEAPVSENVAAKFGKGIPAQVLINAGIRPVGITITNTTSKPIMLSPFYGSRFQSNAVDFWTGLISGPVLALWIAAAGITGYGTIGSLLALGLVDRYDRPIALGFALTFVVAFFASTGMAIHDGIVYGEFGKAMRQKFEELNFKDETLIFPGQTVKKLLICTKDEYISRFPLVAYPLENREEMIVFDVDLRA